MSQAVPPVIAARLARICSQGPHGAAPGLSSILFKTVAAGLLAAVVAAFPLPKTGAAADAEAIERGKYVFDAAGCETCHTDEENKGPPLAGGRKLVTPFGIFYSPNITPDPETGIGNWSSAEFRDAIRHGTAPDGSNYFPVFPYPSYTGMQEADIRDLWAYIASLDPVSRPNRPHDVNPPFGWRFLMTFWKWMFFETGPMPGDPEQDAEWNRGAYIANALAHCGECHTPRNRLGALDRSMTFAGTKEGPEGGSVPNITPHPETGIGDWSADEIDTMFTFGMLPDGDFVGSSMADVVSKGTARLTPADRKALITYLQSLPPIDNNVSGGSGE